MLLLKLVILLIAVLFIYGLFKLTRKLIPEFDAWWIKANKLDDEYEALQKMIEEEIDLEEKARLIKRLNSKRYASNRDKVSSTIKERRPS